MIIFLYNPATNPDLVFRYLVIFKSATFKEVEENNFVLTPGRYVGTEDVEDDGISFEDKIAVISENLKSHFEQSILLQERIKENLKKVGIEL
jgi:type I restriction enzyme M protein